MKPHFWARFSWGGFARNKAKTEFLIEAQNAVVNQRILVRKTVHQLDAVDIDFHGAFTKPLVVRDEFVKNWSKHTTGLSEEEVADLSQARDQIDHYEKVYNIHEYCTEMN